VVCDRLGDGGTAGVYLAWDFSTKSWCALKALLHTHLKNDSLVQRFRAEAQTMARLQHPNVARILHHDMDAMPPYLVMELARCGSAMMWVKKHGPMPPSLAVDVLVQMCEALHVAHGEGIVHRDVKPHNFLLDDEGVCKLTDFGIARVDDHTSMTATGSQIGTFSFMAPEQRSDTKRVDHRADVYALGSSLFTLLTARTSAELFIAEDDDAILERVPEPFRPVVARACQYAPDDRYPDVLSFQTALLSALSRLPSEAGDYPELVQPAGPLPAGPPEWLPEGLDLDDLMRSLGLDLDQPTYVPSVPPPPKRTYQMSRPEPSAAPMAPSESLPSYLDASEVEKEAKRESALAAARAEQQQKVAAEAERRRELEEAADAALDPRVMQAVGLTIAVVVGLVLLVLLGGTGHVMVARSATDAASDTFTGVLANESAVVYELGGDRTFEELYQRYLDASGPARIAAAVAFADALEREVQQRTLQDPRVAARVQRILSARDRYVDAYEGWRGAASGFPGSVPVSIGLVSGPGG
jgi:serine/threonine protein kinase